MSKQSDISDVFGDHDGGGYCYGVYSGGHLNLDSCNVFGIHSGVSSFGTLYANGGTYTGVLHGGIYFTSFGTNTSSYVQNATIAAGDYSEYDWSIVNGYCAAAFYVGGNTSANYINAYIDNCTIVNPIGYAFRMRTTKGEHDNSVYISNTTLDLGGRTSGDLISIDSGSNLLVHVGKGTNITTDMTSNPGALVFTDEVYSYSAE